jgi:cell wall-associated NlpC family hydrolase
MRFGRLRSFIAVLWTLAFPGVAAATPQPSSEVEPNPLSLEAEHAALSQKGATEALQRPKRPGRPRVVAIALRYLGIPYRWAGASPAGFDCSGFVMYVYGRVGISLPHNSAQLWNVGRPISRNRLEPGDVVFFHGLGHVGIYVGRGRFVHSPQTGDVVKVTRFSEGQYRSSYDGARRYR